jgi:outer membrane protein TolC
MGNEMPHSMKRTMLSIRIAIVFGLTAVLLAPSAYGQQPSPARVEPVQAPPNDKAKEDVLQLSLADCIAVAVERQPALKAVRASQDASAAGQQALQNMGRLASLLSRDLPVRKEQASYGMVAASADVQKTYNEVVHDVTRLYYSVVYARQQEQLVNDVVAQTEAFVDIGKKLLRSTTPGEMTQAKLDVMLISLAKVRRMQGRAQTGVKQSEAALREILGVADGSLPFRVKDKELPVMEQDVPLTKEQVVQMALSRRPEMTLSAAGAEAFRLEVCAQDRVRFRRSVPTLAAGSDLHARLLPSGSRDPRHDYRPEPIVPEMPTLVVGRRADRVARVQAYSRRADAVHEKVRDLLILEAETTFFDFEDAAKSLTLSKEGYTASKDLMERIREGFDNPKAAKDQLLVNYGQAAEAQAEYVQTVFQYLLEMAAMERVTAGGVRPAFPGR